MTEYLRHGAGACRRSGLGMALLTGLLLTACAPSIRPPSFTPREQVPLAGLPTGQAGWPAAQWWQQYQDPQLDRLMQMAAGHATTLEQALARYRRAARQVDSERAKLGPTIGAAMGGGLSYGRTRIDGLPAELGRDSYSHASTSAGGLLGVGGQWDLDLWGKQKAAVAQAVGQTRAAEAEQAVTANSLQYQVASTYFSWQTDQSRLALSRHSEQLAAHQLQLAQARVGAGIADPRDIDTAAAQLAQLRQTSASLDGQAKLDLTGLAAIIGVDPQQLDWLQPRPLPIPDTRLPADARIGLIARRPDIAAARWQIEASSRQIDQARAAFYPDVSLSALGAYLSSDPSFGSGLRLHGPLGGIGPSITLPIFESGRLKAAFESSQAALDSAVADYNNTIVQAAHDVAQRVVSLQQLQAEQLQQQARIAAIASSGQRLERMYHQGIADQRPLLDNQLQIEQLQDTQLQLHGQLLDSQLGLIHALGGGYHNTALPALPAHSTQDAH
ncbi:efflux transporter outer membrane subunit [Frateuria aurantia]